MFLASHPRDKAFQTLFIILVIMTISALLAGCSNQGADSIFGENYQKPYDQATEELAIQNYVEKIDQEWTSFLIELSETEEKIDDLVDQVSLLSSSDYLNVIDSVELSVLEEQIESELAEIEVIKNQFKMIAPLRSAQDYLDYTDTRSNEFIEEVKVLINLFEEMSFQDADIEEVEEQMKLGLSDINRRPYMYEQILFEEDVQDYMEPYVEYAEEMVVYIGLQTLLLNQEANVITSLIHITEQAGETSIVEDQNWAIFNTEMVNLLTIQDRLESEPVPIFTSEDLSNSKLHHGQFSALLDLPVSAGTSQPSTTVLLCGKSQHNAVQSKTFICPDISEKEKKFLEEMDKKWQDYLKEWERQKAQGMNDIVEEYLEKKNAAIADYEKCVAENCSDQNTSPNCYCFSDEKDLYWEYRSKFEEFVEKMEREKDNQRDELDQEIENWKNNQEDVITKQLGLTLTANHQMFVASRPAYTIQVSGTQNLTFDPWYGLLNVYYFPMAVNWPVGQGVQVVGGDMVSMVIDGRCEDGIMYLTFYGEHFGYTGYGEVVNPVIYAPVTIYEYRNKSSYNLQFNMAGSGGTASIPASERNSELGGTLTWILEANQ